MQRRFALFETLCLPALAAQTDPDFRLVVLMGDAMPIRWRRRLKSLRAEYTFLEICAVEPLGPLQATRRAFRVGADERLPFVTGFRLDDDDAVAVDYVERLREIADRLLDLGWADALTPVVVGYQTGLYWPAGRSRAAALPLQRVTPTGQASAMVTAYDHQHNIFAGTTPSAGACARAGPTPNPTCSCGRSTAATTARGHPERKARIVSDGEAMRSCGRGSVCDPQRCDRAVRACTAGVTA
jgi:hypothetical protein